MIADRLEVRWEGDRVGTLARRESRYGLDYEFEYGPGGTRPISVALPVRPEPYAPPATMAFFEGLLPEGTLREALAGRFRLPFDDGFGLLERIGRDCAGALQVLPADSDDDEPDVRWLDDEDLAALITELPRRPLGMTAGGGMRLSLAGAQRKAVLVRDAVTGRFGEPLGAAASTHLLKPEDPDGEYPGIVANESFCMRLAKRIGLPVAAVEVIEIAGRPALVVERYDRQVDADRVVRRHQEDLCQALGLPPGFKYQSPERDRPGFADIAEVLDEHGRQPGRDRLTAARMAVLNFVLGNADAHGKNVSFLHDSPGRIRLAPLYDLVSTGAWPELDPTMAMAVDSVLDPAGVTPAAFDGLAAELGLAVAGARRDREKLIGTIRRAVPAVRDEARREGWDAPVLDAVERIVQRRASQLTAT